MQRGVQLESRLSSLGDRCLPWRAGSRVYLGGSRNSSPQESLEQLRPGTWVSVVGRLHTPQCVCDRQPLPREVAKGWERVTKNGDRRGTGLEHLYPPVAPRGWGQGHQRSGPGGSSWRRSRHVPTFGARLSFLLQAVGLQPSTPRRFGKQLLKAQPSTLLPGASLRV